MNKSVFPGPFAHNEEEQPILKTFYQQREASYKTSQEPIYQGDDHKAYYDNYEAPTPQINEIDGYKSEEEINS